MGYVPTADAEVAVVVSEAAPVTAVGAVSPFTKPVIVSLNAGRPAP